jgi:hypothetical protein
MTKYKIIMERTIETEYFVEAENEEEANERFIEGNCDEGETEILHSETYEPEEIK